MERENCGLKTQAKALYDRNRRQGRTEGVEYHYTCPSPFGYPHQWLWDQSFHSIVLAELDIDRSKKEITTLLSGQRSDGFSPCVIVWKNRHPLDRHLHISNITQPPVVPIAVEAIFEKSGDVEFVKEVYPKLKQSVEWLNQNRDRNRNGLLEIIHPWEDGDDGNPSFDKQLKMKKDKISAVANWKMLFGIVAQYARLGWDEGKIYDKGIFRAETGLFNSIYTKSLLSLVNLAGVLGNREDAIGFAAKYQTVKNAMINFMWNEEDGIFYDLDAGGKQSGVKSISSLMPLILPDLPERIYRPLIENHLLNPKEYWTPIPIASVAKSEPTFSAGGGFELWRGPMWVNTNWFLARALLNYGYEKEAKSLVIKTADVIERHGFREYYNPFPVYQVLCLCFLPKYYCRASNKSNTFL